MNSRIRIVSIGFLWGWLQGSVLILAIFFTGHYEIGLVSAILISFFAGRKLYDVESMFRALLLSTFVALTFDLLVVIIWAQLTFVSPAGFQVATFPIPRADPILTRTLRWRSKLLPHHREQVGELKDAECSSTFGLPAL